MSFDLLTKAKVIYIIGIIIVAIGLWLFVIRPSTINYYCYIRAKNETFASITEISEPDSIKRLKLQNNYMNNVWKNCMIENGYPWRSLRKMDF